MKIQNKKTGEREDYEEPKNHWFIDCDGKIYSIDRLVGYDLNKLKEIGNYFETEEEAEKAVEKLKTWKRLKDNGISFEAKVIDRKWYLEPKAEPQQTHDFFKLKI